MAYRPKTLAKSQTFNIKDVEAKAPASIPLVLESTRPASVKSRRSVGLLTSTFTPSNLRKASSVRRRSKGKMAYDNMLSSSFNRQTVQSVSIEDKYSWLKAFRIVTRY